MRSSFGNRLWAGVVAGLLAGLCSLVAPDATATQPDQWTALLMGMASGVTFAFLFGHLARSPGAGLLWGAAHGLFWWFVVVLGERFLLNGSSSWQIEPVRAALPQLFLSLICYGGLVGLVYAPAASALAGQWGRQAAGRALRAYVGAALIGGLAGWIGGLAFGAWMARVDMFPLIAGLVGSESAAVGRSLHFVISMIIGVSYGLLFRQDVRGLGPSIAWGLAYGFIWWIVGGMTLLPWWLGEEVTWTVAAAQQSFGSLIGHLVYGVLLGIVYAAIDRFVRLLFTESDPLYRDPEGPGTRSLRALSVGALGSVAGGLLFTWVMVETGVLPLVANLVGQTSPTVGFLVHMTISTVIGATYGLLFWRESATYGDSLAWGLIYGFTWWILGPLTLMPILLGGDVQWTLAAAVEAYPSLVGHLVYGAATALGSHTLMQRYTIARRIPAWQADTQGIRSATTQTPAPALWVFVLVIAITLPLLLAS